MSGPHAQDADATSGPFLVVSGDGTTRARPITTHSPSSRSAGQISAELCVPSSCCNPQGLALIGREARNAPRIPLLLGADPAYTVMREQSSRHGIVLREPVKNQQLE